MRRRRLLLGGVAGLVTACRRPGAAPEAIPPGATADATTPADELDADDDDDEGEFVAPARPSDPYASLRGFCDGIAAPDADEYAAHQRRMDSALTEAGRSALVAESGATMSWLSGVRWGKSERPFVAVMRRGGRLTWVVPSFEEGTAREQLGDAEVVLWREHESPYAAIAKLVDKSLGPVALDGELRGFIGSGLAEALGRRRVVDGRPVVTQCRMHKTPRELARLRRANEATKQAIALVAPSVGEGATQAEIAERITEAQRAAGLESVWTLALVGESAAYPHGTRQARPVREGDLVLVDTGGGLHGYRSDISRTWAVGEPPPEVARAWETVAKAQRAALELMRPGVRTGDVDAAARKVIADAGFGDGYTALTHRLGHGIGLQTHEEPYLRPDNDRVLAPGMTMSNEPGIYVRGQYGVRLEDIVAITEDAHEVFGPLPGSLSDPFGNGPAAGR